MIASRLSAAGYAFPSHCRCSAVSGSPRTISVIPTMAFIGVQIS